MMKRNEFLRKLIQYILFGILTGIAIFLGSKTVMGNTCSSCPGKGICNGEIDCTKYNLNKDGKA
jgi:hypothetical protein